jgi:tRNA(Arg) A34 adenosine deaminase TadA
VVVSQNRIIARAHNLTETLTDVTAHAEMQAITATNLLGGKYLNEMNSGRRNLGWPHLNFRRFLFSEHG